MLVPPRARHKPLDGLGCPAATGVLRLGPTRGASKITLLRSEQMTMEQALKAAKALASRERDRQP